MPAGISVCVGWVADPPLSDNVIDSSAGNHVFLSIPLLRSLQLDLSLQALVSQVGSRIRIPVKLVPWSDSLHLQAQRLQLIHMASGAPESPSFVAKTERSDSQEKSLENCHWVAVGPAVAEALEIQRAGGEGGSGGGGNEAFKLEILPVKEDWKLLPPLKRVVLRPLPGCHIPRLSSRILSKLLSGELVTEFSVISVAWTGSLGYLGVARLETEAGVVGPGDSRIHRVGPSTEVSLLDSAVGTTGEEEPSRKQGIDRGEWAEQVAAEFGGLRGSISRLVSMAAASLFEADRFAHAGLTPRKGVLLTGPPGCGKSGLAHSLVRNSRLPYAVISGPEVFQKNQGESERLLRETFDRLALAGGASFLIVDEIDIIAGRIDAERPIEARLASQLCSLIDGLFTRRVDAGPGQATIAARVFVIGLTNRPESLDPSLTRAGRLDCVINLALKSAAERREILAVMTRGTPMAAASREAILAQVSELTSGYVGADLLSLCREAALCSLTRERGQVGEAVAVPRGVALEDFASALLRVRPSALSDSGGEGLPRGGLGTARRTDEGPFSSLGGLDKVIRELQTSVLLPFTRPGLFARLGISPPSGILLAGPPGTGKTQLAMKLAAAASFNMVVLDPGQIRSRVVGESEAALARVFRQAREASPCFLIIDQLELIAAKRDSFQSSSGTEGPAGRLVALLLTEMDGIFGKGTGSQSFDSQVVIVGTTSQADQLDPAIIRPGRLDRVIHLTLPDFSARREIFRVKLRGIPLRLEAPQEATLEGLLDQLSKLSEGRSGAEIENVCREAAMQALRLEITSESLDPGLLVSVLLRGSPPPPATHWGTSKIGS